MRALPSIAVMFLVVGCQPWQDPALDTGAPAPVSGHLVVSPDDLDFSAMVGDHPIEQTFTILNDIGHAATVYGLADPDGDESAFEVLGVPDVIVLEQGEAIDVPVRFVPPSDGLFHAAIKINESHTVRLTGDGLGAHLKAETLQTAEVPIGCRGVTIVALRNVGRAPLDLDVVEVDADATFELLDEMATRLGPDEEQHLRFAYRPSRRGQQVASATVLTNDPVAPRVELLVAGHAVGDVSLDAQFVYDGGDAAWTLETPPEPMSVAVEVDGEVTKAWDVDPESRTVWLLEPPALGARIDIRYSPAGVCP